MSFRMEADIFQSVAQMIAGCLVRPEATEPQEAACGIATTIKH